MCAFAPECLAVVLLRYFTILKIPEILDALPLSRFHRCVTALFLKFIEYDYGQFIDRTQSFFRVGIAVYLLHYNMALLILLPIPAVDMVFLYFLKIPLGHHLFILNLFVY